MKKKIMVILCVLVMLLFLVSIIVMADNFFEADIENLFDAAKKANTDDKTVVAIVEGKKIYQETIDFLAAGEKISINNNASVIDESDTDSQVDIEGILKNQIRNAVVLAEAERLGLEVTEEEAKEYTMKSYNAAKEQGGQVYQFLVDYMNELNLTEEEYLDRCIHVNKSKLTRAKLYDKFASGKTETYEEIVAEYEMYVDELIENADIEYK